MAQRVIEEGIKIGRYRKNLSQKECEDLCDDTEQCKSFTYAPSKQRCELYDKKLVGNEPQKKKSNHYTVYKSCGEHVHNDININILFWILRFKVK